MTDQNPTNSSHHTHPTRPSDTLPEEILLAVALRQQYRIIPTDGVPRIGAFTVATDPEAVLSSRRLPLPEQVPDQRLARYINTVTDPGESTLRDLFLRRLGGPVLGWWLTVGDPDGARLAIATTPAGGWYDAVATEGGPDPTIGVYADGHAPAGIDQLVGCLGELAVPTTLRRQSYTTWAAFQTRMCACWHPFAEHHLDGPDHPCGADGCGCGRFATTDDALPGRWVGDTPAALAVLHLAGSCATATHYTSPDGRRWHWVPDFLTRLPA